MRLKIGLALGSGAARGWAHIGILESLGKLGIVPEIVTGTSIGALVGAAFATGRLAALKSRMENFTRADIATMLDVRLASGGLIEGARIENFLDSLGIQGAIETFACRYGAVATDLATGREVWFQKGPVGRAVRASIGMPGVFSPARYDEGGGWLVDGGLVNPVPVSLARALGADVVIAVDLNSELLGRRFANSADEAVSALSVTASIATRVPPWLKGALDPVLARVLQPGPANPSYFEVLANTLNIMQDRITRARLAGDPPDIFLRPRLGKFSWLDFHRAKEAIAHGVACVEHAEAAIRSACPVAHPGA
jgi:NTE family protein